MYLGPLVILLLHHGVQGVEVDTIKSFAALVGQKIKEGTINTLHDGVMNTLNEGVVLTKKSDVVLRYMADTVVTTALLGCLRLIPDTVEIPPLDLDLNLGGPGHLTADKGRLRGLSSARVRPIVYDVDSNGGILITFPITFTDLHIVYERFQIECWPIVMTGAADLKFTDSKVNVNIRLAKPGDLLEKITSRECVFHVGSIQFSGFQEMEPKIALDGVSGHKFLSEHVFPVVASEIKKVMLHMVDVRVTNSLYDSLPASGRWLCRDPALNRVTLQTTGPVTFTPAGVANWLPASTEGKNTNRATAEFDSSKFEDPDSDTLNFDSDTLNLDSDILNVDSDEDFNLPLIKIYE